MTTSFEALNLNPQVIAGLKRQNITTPTPIQALTLPAFKTGKDLMIESYTGSGKTLAFLLPLFEKINFAKGTQAIILAPTHELAHQIHEQIKLLAHNSQLPITSALLMGEVSIDKQIVKLREKPHIIVGSAGRILDLILKKKIHTPSIENIVLDEADNLLGHNQKATIKKLLHQLPTHVQITLFSASMGQEVKDLALPLSKNPEFISVAPSTELNPMIEHFYVKGEPRQKFELLKKLLQATDQHKILIFVSQHTDTQALVEKLAYHDFKVATISGKLSKEERKRALNAFKSGKVNILLSSDLAARGLDIPHIRYIIHYDTPLTAADYLHRSGRTARNGEKGTSISLVMPKDLGMLRILERTFKVQPQEILLVKGQMKNITTGDFIVVEAPLVQEIPAKKSRNKYPKGFVSDKASKKEKKKSQEASKPSLKTKKVKMKQQAAPADDFLASGSLADALRLIEESQFDD